jgi:Ni/Fe-hydrogenase 1 B-type cytochrome subunit
MLKRIHVWSLPVRILHWTHVVTVGILVVTGLYIGYPFMQGGDVGATYLMGGVRFVHFTAAFVLVAGFLARFYWFFWGNCYERWQAWLPLTRKQWHNVWRQLKYYLFLSRQRPNYVGINPVAGLTYLATGILVVLQALTGFALFALPFDGGFWPATFGRLNLWLGAQPLRLVHHTLTWLFVAFAVVHIYMAVLDDVEERTGDLSSIIGGDKFEPIPREQE